MYSRGLGPIKQDCTIPEKYDGTALLDLPVGEADAQCGTAPKFIDAQKKEIKISPTTPHEQIADESYREDKSEAASATPTISSRWLSGIFADGFSFGNVLQRIELEDLIIIGLAAFLFFSKSGDKECALMLLALIFIG